MADDMANDTARQYLDAAHAQLGERVTNLGRRQTDLEGEMRSGFRQMEQSITSFTNETRQSIAALGTAISEKNKPQYQALGFALSVILAVGALAYWPIRESTNDLKTSDMETSRTIQLLATETNKSIQALAANTVSRQEMDWRADRGTEDRTRMEGSIAALRASTILRSEFEAFKLDIQRQIDRAERRTSP